MSKIAAGASAAHVLGAAPGRQLTADGYAAVISAVAGASSKVLAEATSPGGRAEVFWDDRSAPEPVIVAGRETGALSGPPPVLMSKAGLRADQPITLAERSLEQPRRTLASEPDSMFLVSRARSARERCL